MPRPTETQLLAGVVAGELLAKVEALARLAKDHFAKRQLGNNVVAFRDAEKWVNQTQALLAFVRRELEFITQPQED